MAKFERFTVLSAPAGYTYGFVLIEQNSLLFNEALAWCLDQFGNIDYLVRNPSRWDFSERWSEIYFDDAGDATAFRLRWC